jgi:iron complex outermembrane receptor protein
MRLKAIALCSTALLLGWAPAAHAQSTDTPASDSPSGVPVTTQAAPSTDQATTPVEDEAAPQEDIVVTGLRRSLQSAQNFKRNSPAIVDAIVAQDIGKLPDIAASDSLARVVGVQVERRVGEAGRVLVRGLEQYPTTYNGRDIFTAEARRVAIQDFPAGGVGALEVYKSTTADQIEGGLAGLVNVRARRPFDFQGFQIAGEIRADHTTQAQAITPNGNLLITNRFDTGIGEMGALVNVSYTQLEYRDSARYDGGIGLSSATNAAGPAFRRPNNVGVFYNSGDRRRPSVNGAFQWRPTEEIEFTIDGLYQGFRRKVSDRNLNIDVGEGTFSNILFRPGTNAAGEQEAQSLTSSNVPSPFSFQGATREKTDTYQVGANLTYTTDRLRVSLDAARTDTKFDLSVYSVDTILAGRQVVDVNFDVPREDGGAEFFIRNVELNDPRNWLFTGFFDRRLIARGDDYQLRGDVNFKPGEGSFITSLDVGVRYSDRNGDFRNGERFGGPVTPGQTLADLPLDLTSNIGGFKGSDVQSQRTWVRPTYNSIRSNIEFLRTATGQPVTAPAFFQDQTFDANEKILAGYAQLKYEVDLGVRIDGVLGVRVARTDVTLRGNDLVNQPTGPAIFVPRTDSNEFTDYLPTGNIRLRFTDDLQLRGSVNKTRTLPNFSDLNPALFIDPSVGANGFRNGRGGNIDLDPFESWNYDLILEYYFGRTGTFTAGLFRKDVSGFIQRRAITFTDPSIGPETFQITVPINEDDIRLQGAEAQFTAFADFDGLPRWAQGFGIQVNGTYIDQKAKGDALPIAGVSKYSYNLVGLYEQGPISLRLAYNWRSKFTALDFPDPTLTTRAIDRLDFSANLTPIENVTLTFNAVNILGAPFRNVFQYENGGSSYPRDVRFEETVYSFGLRFRI